MKVETLYIDNDIIKRALRNAQDELRYVRHANEVLSGKLEVFNVMKDMFYNGRNQNSCCAEIRSDLDEAINMIERQEKESEQIKINKQNHIKNKKIQIIILCTKLDHRNILKPQQSQRIYVRQTWLKLLLNQEMY